MEAASLSMVFEGIMIVCFGVSWPAAIWKTLRARTVSGMSPVFLWFVFTGYLSGILFKLSDAGTGGDISPIIILYAINGLMVMAELVLYYRFREAQLTRT